MQSKELDAALAMIDSSRWSRAATKYRVLSVVRVIFAHYGPRVPIGSRVVAAATGMHLRTARVALHELVDDGVLVVVLAPSGSRGAIYDVDGRVSRWRVPWDVEIELVELRLARLGGRLPDHNPGVVRAVPRAQQPSVRAPWRALIPDSARGGARTDDWIVRAGARAQASDDAPSAPFTSIEELASYSSSIYDEVCKAIVARTGQGVFGKLANELQSTLAGVDDAEPYVEAVRRHPNPVAGPPVLVRDLATVGAPGDDPTPARPTAPAEPPEWLLEQSARQVAEAAELAASFTPAAGTLAARAAARGQNGHTPKGGTE